MSKEGEVPSRKFPLKISRHFWNNRKRLKKMLSDEKRREKKKTCTEFMFS